MSINIKVTPKPIQIKVANLFYQPNTQLLKSVNGKIGNVVLSASDVGAESVGAVQALSDSLQPQINDVLSLAQTNQLNIGTKADQLDLDATNAAVEINRLALLTKADLSALATLTLLVGSKADQGYVNDQIANLVGTDGQVLAAIQSISNALAENDNLLDALDQTVANRVRFDVATQALTALQQENARINIGAEAVGAANAVVDALQPQIDTLTLTTNAHAISIATKADQATVDDEFVAVNNLINTGLAAANQAINTKASQTDLVSLDARVVSNSTAIGTKADAVETSQALATKATITALNQVKSLAEANQLNISTKVDQIDFDSVSATVTAQGLTLLNKADIAALTTLAQLVDTKADQSYVISEIARITGNAPAALDTLAEIAEQLGNDQTQINNLLSQIGNRVRFDAAQALTTVQQTQVRDNINAEAKGVAASLVSSVTVSSIGAATAAQGTKANTALQSGDVAPVALSGSFSDLVNKSNLFNLVYSAYALGSSAVITASDTLGQMLGKLQSQVSANDTAISGKEPSITSGNTTQYWRGDKTWQNLATVATTNSYNDLSNKPTLLKGDTGATGNSLMRPTQAITSASGVVTIDLSNGKEVYLLTLTENVTSWSFINLPSSGLIAEIRIRLVQGASSAYTCASPATSGLTAGGTWVNSSALGAIESLGIAIDGSGNKTLFPSGVYA